MSENNERQLARVNDQPGAPVAVTNPNDLSASVQSYWTSMDLSKPGARGRLFTALQNADTSVEAHLGDTIQLADVVAHSVLLPNKEGTAMTEKTRVVLIDSEGVTYSCVSDGMKRTLTNLFQLVGRPPFDPPLPVTLRQVGTKRGFRTFTLEVADSVLGDAPQPKKAKKT